MNPRRDRRAQSLATSVMLLTLVMTMLSLSIVSLAALVGVYDLARSQVSARHQAYLQAVAGDISLRLDPARRLVTRAIAVSVDTETGAVDRSAMAAQFDTGIEFVDQLLLVNRDGTVVSSYPTFRAPRTVEQLPLVAEATPDDTLFHYERTDNAADSRLWAARAVEGESGLVMVARVRSGFVRPVVDRFADQSIGRWTLLIDGQGAPIVSSVGASGLVPESVVYDAGSGPQSEGTVSAVTDDETIIWGHYLGIEGFPGLEWRAVIVEPRASMVMATVRALTPAVLALFVSGLTTLVLVWVFARRLVSPLTHLEERAREAVTGAYVRPLESDRTDEVGRLALAFNAIALRLNALHDLSQLLASSSRLDQVLDGIVSAMGHIVGTANVAVFLIDDQRGTLALARARDLADDAVTGVALDEGSWLVEAMHAAGPEEHTAFGDDVATFVPGTYGSTVTVLTAPLVVGTEPLGVVLVIEDGRRVFTEAETEMVRTFSAQAAVAVHNSRLFEVETRSRTEAEVLRAVAEQLTHPSALAESLESVRETSAILLGASVTGLAVLDRPAFGLSPATDAALERWILAAWREQRGEDGATTMVLEAGDGEATRHLLEQTSASRALLTTVETDGEPRAVLAFMRSGERAFTLRDQRLAATLANQLALALDSAYHFEQASQRAVNLETIFRISQAVSSSLQTKVVLNRVLDVVQKIFTADAIALMTYDPASGRIVTEMARGMISSDMLYFETESGQAGPGMVFASGEPSRTSPLSPQAGGIEALAAAQGLRSLVSVPLLARGRSIGVLTVFSTAAEAFTDEDTGLLHTFASQAALAIDTAKLYGKEHMVASVLQASILPSTLPEFHEVESSSVYLPAGVEADIGGDYYDLFRSPMGTIFIVMGDVCGKGVVAATKTSMIKYTVRGLAAAGLGPAEVLTEVNRMVADTGDTSDIVTLWIGELDAEAGTLGYANGGHPAALLRREADRSIVRMPPTGALLGASASAGYELETVGVEPGDLLLLYTDGVTEARRGNKFFGEGRVERVLRASADANDATQRLLSALDRFVPGAIRDDAAILALRVSGADAPTESNG